MFKYFHIIKFLITHDLTELKQFWESDFIKNKKFKWTILFVRLIKKEKGNYFFWWRLANEMHLHGNKKQRKVSMKINSKLIFKYNADIMLGAKIGKNLILAHQINITIHHNVEIGNNCSIMQNVTIGANNFGVVDIKIGDNVFIGTGTVIIGGELRIGDNVIIGALSFVKKDIPNNHICYTKKELIAKPRTQ